VTALAALCADVVAPLPPASAAAFVPISGAGSTWSDSAINDAISNIGTTGMKVSYQPVVLAAAGSGFGTYTLSARLQLAVPANARAGPTC